MRFFLFMCTLLLTGCASSPQFKPVDNPDAEWLNHQQQISALQKWRLKGRIAIKNDHEAWFLKVDWQQHMNDYAVFLSGPFSGVVSLSGGKDNVELNDGEQSYQAPDAEILLLEHTGIRMPVNGLRYWLLGLPQPDREVRNLKLDVTGRLSSLRQDEWQVNIDRYQQYNGKSLPAKIIIQNHQLNVRLIVDQWQLSPINS